MAAGFTVRTERLDELRKRLSDITASELAQAPLEPTLAIDCSVGIADATWETRRALRWMEPFGAGHPPPLLQRNDVRVRSVRLVRGDNVQMCLSDGSAQTWDGIAFRQPALAETVKAGDRVDIAYNLEDQTWNGEQSLRVVIRDVHPR